MKTNQKILIATAAGLIAGGMIALFFTPLKGSDVRKKIGDKGKDAAGLLGDLVKEAGKKWEGVRERATSFAVNKEEEQVLP